jgi:DNA-binding response OmpR family regulator
MLSQYLGEAGFSVTHAGTGAAGLALAAHSAFDVLVLDLTLPDMDGLEVCRQLRAKSDLPVLMLTARGDAMDRVVGLELGADDYLGKPFEPRELLARLRALLRRGRGAARDEPALRQVEINRGAQCARRWRRRADGLPVRCSPRSPGARAVLSREVLMDW